MNEEEGKGAVVTYSEVNPETIGYFQSLMARKGCWCIYWRVKSEEFHSMTKESRKDRMENIIRSGTVPGILAYVDGMPAGWCSVAPRKTLPGLSESRVLAAVDEEPVWSVVCFYLDRRYRGRGLTSGLLRQAVKYSAKNGARIVEAYPLDVEGTYRYTSAAYTGFLSTFIKAGFVEVERRSGKRPIVRYKVTDADFR